MKIASVQINSVWENLEQNLTLAQSYTEHAHENNCDLIVLPEMFNSGFSMNISKTAEEPFGQTYQFLCNLALKNNISIIAGITELSNTINKAVNVALVINKQGKLITSYTKNYSFNLANEGQYFQQGNKQVVFDLEGLKSSIFICYDLRFPEIFRAVSNQVHVIYVIANWPESRQRHWNILLQARAIENQCFIVAVNRTGSDDNGLNYIGGSQIINPMGEVLSIGDFNQDCIFYDLDASVVNKIRMDLPFLKDMKN
ncbi:MAG: nitrilase-related carbon-nitrogen hydrolase [Marinicellaceae bacterium]